MDPVASGASRDGLSASTMGMPDIASPLAALVVRNFDLGQGQAERDNALAAHAPALALLSTFDDRPTAWLRAGQALEVTLLMLAAEGFTSSFLNQPIEVPRLRDRLRELGADEVPQILLRAGRGPKLVASARRRIDDILI